MTNVSRQAAAARLGKPGSTMFVSRRAACGSITAAVRKACGCAKMAPANPRTVARKERCQLATACAGLQALARKEQCQSEMACAGLQAVARRERCQLEMVCAGLQAATARSRKLKKPSPAVATFQTMERRLRNAASGSPSRILAP